MDSRTRLVTTLNHKIPDRVPMVDISYWPETLERWYREGLPRDVSPADFFDMDSIVTLGFDGSFRLPVIRLEETDDYIIERDSFGATVKSWKNHYATPSRLDFTIKTWDDWLNYKSYLDIDETRIEKWTVQAYRQYREKGHFIALSPLEPAWFLIEMIMGFEGSLTAMAVQKDLAGDIIETYTGFTLAMCQLCIDKGMRFDGLWMFSDLCYKNGMLFSPAIYKELLMPYHKQIAAFCRKNDMPMILHCDGDVRQFIPLLIEAGFDCIQPLEARCGNDVRELKRLYGTDIVFFGNIGTDIMSQTKTAIEEEVRTKVLIAKENGGYIYHCDHSIPPTVNFENYSYVIELVKRYGQY